MRQIMHSKEKLKNSPPEKTGKENVKRDHGSKNINAAIHHSPDLLVCLAWQGLVSTPGAELQSRAPELTVTLRSTEGAPGSSDG